MADEVNYKVAEDFKGIVTLFSGREVTIDMMKITAQEWRQALKAETNEQEAEIIAKAANMKAEELIGLPLPDYRLIVDSFVRLGVQPLANPT